MRQAEQARQQPRQQPQASDAEAEEAGSGFVPAPDDLDDLPEADAAGAAEATGGDNQRRSDYSVHSDETVKLISNPNPNPNPKP
jgi:hypothetical protein